MSEKVRAKFVATSDAWIEGERTVQLDAVTNDSEENKSWSEYTPSGSLSMTISNPSAQDFFELGQEYFLDFTKA